MDDPTIQDPYKPCMMTRTINISLPAQLLKEIDEAAKGNYASRSDFIRETMVLRLKNQQVVKISPADDISV